MMTYTETGLALLASSAASGSKILFTRIELMADPERSPGELTYPAEIESVTIRGSTSVLLKAYLDNTGFEEDYYFNSIKVYAENETGNEVLFCFQKSETCPFYIPKDEGGRPVLTEISINVTVTSTELIRIEFDGKYVLQTDFEKRMDMKSHIVVATAGQMPEKREPNTFYLKVTERQTIGSADNLKVSPNMGLCIL